MKKQLDTISHLLVHFEEFSGIRFSWNFVNVVLGECVDRRQLSHDNVFCRLVKKSPGKWTGECIRNHYEHAFRRALIEGEPFIHHCPAGAKELMVPVYFCQELIGILSAGPFQSNLGCRCVPAGGEYAALPSLSDERLKSLGRFLNHLIRQIGTGESEQWNAPLVTPIRSQDKSFVKVASFIRTRLPEPLTAVQVATACGMSVSKLLHNFRREVGYTFSDYLQRLRLIEARKLIVGSDLPFEEIAARYRLVSSSRMAMLCRRYLGATPSRLRRESNLYRCFGKSE